MMTGWTRLYFVLISLAAAGVVQAQEDGRTLRLRQAIERAERGSFHVPQRDNADAVQQANADRQRQQIRPDSLSTDRNQTRSNGADDAQRSQLTAEDRAKLRSTINSAREIYTPPPRP